MPNVPLPTRLSPLDLTLVALYLVAITIFGLQFRNKSKDKSLKNYFLANNTIPWGAIALSIVSAETSTLTIISIPGVAFAGDFGFLQVVLGYMAGRIVVAALFLPRYFRGEMLTAYQLIDQRFGHKLHKLTAGLFLLTRAAAEGVRVFAISIVVGIAIGTGDTLSIAIISALTLLYTFEGGMAAVIWTDVVQMALYVAGTLVALYTLGAHAGGWQHIHAIAAPLGKFHWLDFSFNLTKSYTFWAGVLGGTFLTMASHGTDQLMVQRLLAARNLRESRLALLSSGAVIFLQFTLFLLIGVGLFVFYGQHPQAFASNDRIFPSFIVQQMPHGVAGLLVAAILAAAMSNLSAALNSLASTTVIDFYVPFFSETNRVPHDVPSEAPGIVGGSTTQPQAPDTTTISRLATLFWALVLFAIAVYSIHAGGKGHVVEIALSIASVAYGCLLGVFLLGTLTRYATQTGTMIGMATGFATNLLLYQATLPNPLIPLSLHIAFTWYVLIGSAMTFAVGTLFSLILPRPKLRQATAAVLLLSAVTSPLLSFRSEAEQSVVRAISSPGAPTIPLYAPSGITDPDFSSVSTLLNDAIAAKKLPGAVLLIGHNGQIVFHHAYGNRKLANEPDLEGYGSPSEPMTEDTLFDMASLTKVMVTTVAILQLYEQGKLDLDAPVSKYLPEFTTTTGAPNLPPPGVPHVVPAEGMGNVGGIPTDPIRNTSNGSPVGPDFTQATAWKSHITIRELLTHYSGLPEDISLKDPWGLKTPDKTEGIRRAMAAVPYGPPNLTFKYSDVNFITLGVLVEKLSGQPLNVYATDHIFNPLKMSSTYHAFAEVCPATAAVASGAALELPPPTSTNGKPGIHRGYTCVNHQWDLESIVNTAPTAHDNEGTAETNPNFDKLLRGTVHDPTTRRMGGVAGHAGLFSTAADAAIFCQALLDKMTHGTGPFPLRQSTLQMALRPQAPATAVATATIFTQDQTATKGVAQRALGWDLNSAFSRPRGEIFPITTTAHPGSFGHTGFTGTSLWLDPVSNTYVILLANAIHPRGNPPISALRGQVATAAAKALGLIASISRVDVKGSSSISRAKAGSFSPQNPAPVQKGLQPRVVSSQPQPSGAPFIAPSAMSGTPTTPKTARDLARLSTVSYDAAAHPSPCNTIVICDSFGAPPSYHPSTPESYAGPATEPTLTGIDVLEKSRYAALLSLAKAHQNHLRIALVTNQSGVDSQGKRTIDVLLHADPEIELTKLFTPEHGLFGKQDTEHLSKEEDPATHLLVISLYGVKPSDRHPRQSDLRNVDAVVIDLQDAGVRFWTYSSVLGYFLEAAAKANIEVVVLDRPNPVGGVAFGGPMSDPGAEAYVNFMPTPVRHGMTFGELARYYNAYAKQVDLDPTLLDARAAVIGTPGPQDTPPATQAGLHAHLTVVPMQNWTREEYYADTGVPWIAPSPNLRTPRAAILYPGLGLIETTNISVGRGTASPFENIGAPWIDAGKLTAYLETRHLAGVKFAPTTLTIAETPDHYPSHGSTIPGLHFEVTDREHFDSPEFGIELLAALHHLYPKEFQLDRVKTLLVNAEVLAALKAGKDPEKIEPIWQPALRVFARQRAQVLLY